MIGIQKQTKRFSVGAIFLVFVFALLTHFNLGIYTVYAQASVSSSDRSVAATPPAGDTSGGTPTKSGDDMGSYIGNAFMTVFKALLYGLLVFLAFIGSVAASAFLYVLDVSHFQAIMANPVVWEMWKIVRDFMNLFFIFVLLLSAFYTIFQVDKYSYKNVLSKVIFGALFVNFSFPIARAIIDVGNVMMYSFIVDIFGMTGGGLTNGILGTAGLADILVPNGFDKTYELKFYLIAIVCLFMFVVSFLTLALMMLYRLVMLPILVMFSPIGFVAGAIPGMDGYAKQWWDKLIKNVFFGPIAVFMMMISVKFLNVWGSSNAVKAGFSQAAVSSSDASGTLISGVVYMTIPVIFFWIAITSAEKMSSEAAGQIKSLGDKILKNPFISGAKGVGRWAGRKAESKLAKGKYTKFLSPTVVKEAVKAWSETAKHEDMLPIEMAKAEMHNQINAVVNKVAHSRLGKYLPLHEDSTDYKMLEQTRQMKKYEDEIKQRGGGEISEEVAVAFLMEGLNDDHQEKFLAAAVALPKTNGLDNITHALAARYGMVPGDRMNEKGEIEHAGIVGVDGKPAISVTDNYVPLMMKAMNEAGVPEQLQLKHLYNMGEVAKSKGDLSYGDWVEIKADGTYRLRTPEEHAEVVGKNFAKGKAQTRQDILHGRGLFEQNIGPDPNDPDNTAWGDLNLAGMSVAANFNADDVNSHSRNRGDLPKAVVSAFKAAQDPDPAVRARVANFIKAYNANEHFRNYIWAKQGNDPKGFDKNPPPKLSVEAGGTTRKSSGGSASTYAQGVKADDMKIV